MSIFTGPADSPLHIRIEGQQIAISFDKTSDTTARISWNIPSPAPGCAAGTQAYNGIVITLDNIPVSVSTTPKDGIVYTGDAIGDSNLHAGDKIGTALVIGSFYNDKTTTFFDISGLVKNQAYYVSGFAVDKVNRYHSGGAHAYSLPLGSDPLKLPDSGYQSYLINIQGTDATGLVPSGAYSFDVNIDGTTYTISVNGSNGLTYDDLVSTINRQFALLSNPAQGSVPPNTNGIWVDQSNQIVYKWTGYLNEIQPTIFSNDDPTDSNYGDYWYNADTGQLYIWTEGDPDPDFWNELNVIKFHKDPIDNECDTYWYDSDDERGYIWNGSVWVLKPTNVSTIDPFDPPTVDCAALWYDTENEILYARNRKNCAGNWSAPAWDVTKAITWDTDPTIPTNGDLWVNETDNTLWSWNNVGGEYVEVTSDYEASDTEPTSPTHNDYWYDTSETLLYRYVTDEFVVIPFILWDSDPSEPKSGDLWWDTDNIDPAVISVWDIINSEWVLVDPVYYQANDPALHPDFAKGTLWYNSVSESLFEWDGSEWKAVLQFINYDTDPNTPDATFYWLDTETNTFYNWTGSWTVIQPIHNESNPQVPANGDYWYETDADTLHSWNGVSWVSVGFGTTDLIPTVGSLWFDTGLNKLFEWNGITWIDGIPHATIHINEVGNLVMISGSTGSQSYFSILRENEGMFSYLTVQGDFSYADPGSDITTGNPVYLDHGSDGSEDERRELADSIRRQLGHPTVQVELDPYDLDSAITKALEKCRQISTVAYKRAYFFIDSVPGVQKYVLSDRRVGFHRVVDVIKLHRITSSFLGTTSGGAGVYAQAVLQHLYSMGQFDLVSYYIINEYIELLEQMFVNQIMFDFDEFTRELHIFRSLNSKERILVDAIIERTENELLLDRYLKLWIEKWALAESKLKLAEVRGKYGNLPGPGGGISLNASELIASAGELKEQCLAEIENYQVDRPELVGMQASFVVG